MKRTTASTNTEFAHQLRRDSWWVIFWLFLCVMLLSYFKPIQPLERLNNVIYDFQQRLHPFTVDKEELPFALIIIDDKSLKSLGHWPWRRSIYAELLSHLKEAEVVGIDLLFTNTNPAYPEDDEQLAQAIKEHGRVILPIYIDQENKIEEPITPLLNAAAGVGFINIHPDADGVVRHIRLFHDLNKKKPLERPPLWRMTGTRTQGVSVNSKDTTYPNENQLNHSVVPHFSTALVSITEDAPILESYDLHYLNPHLSPFIGPLGSFNTYPFSKVLAGDYPSEAFKGKYVLIGAWGSGLGDYYPTPFSS